MKIIPGDRYLLQANRKWLVAAAFAIGNWWLPCGAQPAAAIPPRQVKVLIISLFEPEASAWIKPLALNDAIAVPGLSAEFPNVWCNGDDVCQVTTGMGHTNAAASTMAVAFSGKFDLTHTYFLIAGIAGIDPNVATIGSATWARYLVDYGIAHEIDPRELPGGWESGYFGIETNGPAVKPDLRYHTEVFQVNEALLQWALRLSRQVRLDDNDTARAYRAQYPQAPARAPPAVVQCDTAAGDTYWHGNILGTRAEKWTALLTDGKGTYCSTQQEDNAVYEALKRASASQLLDIKRLAVLRTAANFDRPYPGQSAYDSLVNSKSGGFESALRNLYLAGDPLVGEIVTRWEVWQSGVPQP